MATKEQIYKMLDSFTDEQLEQVLIILNSVKKMINIESEDDAFCQKINDIDNGRNLSKPFTSVKELMKDLNADD